MSNDRYDLMSDAELIMSYRDGQQDIMDYIMEKYKYLVRNKAKAMYILGADCDDLIQEGMIGLFKAIRDYDTGRDASFLTFADLCISRQIYTAIQVSGRQKNIPLNNYISLYNNYDSENPEDDSYLIDSIRDSTDMSPEELFIDKENVKNLEDRIVSALSPFENQVLDLFLTGMGYVEIASVLGRDEKSTDNALQRIRSKIRKVLE